MKILISIYIFFLGACFASFALVVASRFSFKKSWPELLGGRSKCDNCGKTLKWFDLVPILSWVAFGGKCRRCRKPLSPVYPLSELASGLVLLLSFWYFPFPVFSNQAGFDWSAVGLFAIWSLGFVLLLILFLIDLRTKYLPYKFSVPLLGLAAVYRALVYVFDFEVFDGFNLMAGLLASGGLFWFLNKISKGRWIGDGDIILGFAIGFFLGGFFEVWTALVVASVSGLIFALVGQGKSKKSKTKLAKMQIPFGPFLIIGLIAALLFSADFMDWYQQTFLYY